MMQQSGGIELTARDDGNDDDAHDAAEPLESGSALMDEGASDVRAECEPAEPTLAPVNTLSVELCSIALRSEVDARDFAGFVLDLLAGNPTVRKI